VITAGATVDNLHGPFGSIRVRSFGAGPLIEDNSVKARSSVLVNAQGGYELTERLRVALDVFNLFDVKVNDIAYDYESQITLAPLSETAPVDDIHLHPSEPREFRLNMVYYF
jgi:outer membrane receptor protein involved in Fe transport